MQALQRHLQNQFTPCSEMKILLPLAVGTLMPRVVPLSEVQLCFFVYRVTPSYEKFVFPNQMVSDCRNISMS